MRVEIGVGVIVKLWVCYCYEIISFIRCYFKLLLSLFIMFYKLFLYYVVLSLNVTF